MTRIGTCLFSYRLREIWNVPPGHQPHLRPTVEVEPEAYLCTVLDWQEEPAPPPIERSTGAFEIRPGDCERCIHFIPAAEQQLNSLLRTYRRRLRARRWRAARRAQRSV